MPVHIARQIHREGHEDEQSDAAHEQGIALQLQQDVDVEVQKSEHRPDDGAQLLLLQYAQTVQANLQHHCQRRNEIG